MISCMYNGKVHYIYDVNDLREVMEESVYECVKKMIDREHTYAENADSNIEYMIKEREDLYNQIEDLKDQIKTLKETIQSLVLA